MVTMQVFTHGMNKLAKRWKEINNLGLEERYLNAVSDLPENAFKEIIYSLLDSSPKMPLPKDFYDAAKEWRNKFYRENGFYYGTDSAQSEQHKVSCNWCLDTGVMRVESHAGNEWKFFSCNCENGKQNLKHFPEFDSKLLQVYKRVPIKPEWFNPFDENLSAEKQDKKLFKKILEWQKLKLDQAKAWKQLGYNP